MWAKLDATLPPLQHRAGWWVVSLCSAVHRVYGVFRVLVVPLASANRGPRGGETASPQRLNECVVFRHPAKKAGKRLPGTRSTSWLRILRSAVAAMIRRSGKQIPKNTEYGARVQGIKYTSVLRMQGINIRSTEVYHGNIIITPAEYGISVQIVRLVLLLADGARPWRMTYTLKYKA